MNFEGKKKRVEKIIKKNWNEWMENLIWYWTEEREHDLSKFDIELMKDNVYHYGYAETWKYNADGFEWELIDWALDEAEKEGIQFSFDEIEELNIELSDLKEKFYKEAADRLNERLVKDLQEWFPDCEVEEYSDKIIIERKQEGVKTSEKRKATVEIVESNLKRGKRKMWIKDEETGKMKQVEEPYWKTVTVPAQAKILRRLADLMESGRFREALSVYRNELMPLIEGRDIEAILERGSESLLEQRLSSIRSITVGKIANKKSIGVYEYGYCLGNEQKLENVMKQITNPNFFKGANKEWIRGYCEGVLNRDDIDEHIREIIQQIQENFCS